MIESKEFIRLAPEVMQAKFETILKADFSPEKATRMARVFMENSLDGVYSHGTNRFARFVKQVREGLIRVDAEPECVAQSGAVEQWHGNSGPGILNAIRCSERAREIAAEHGMGCVALAHTNHWMRGGTYGWEAARAGYAYIAWSNTIAHMPPWGSTDARLGNNPLVLALPYEGQAIVLDMALSQFSFGALDHKIMRGEMLEVPGGYNRNGELTNDPGEILHSGRVLPVGYWKGAGLSLLLDLLGTILSNGLSVHQVTKQGRETNVSQVFIAIRLNTLSNAPGVDSIIRSIIMDYHQSSSVTGKPPVYPGERVLQTREENRRLGIPVAKTIWEEIVNLG
jgi:3-dehydro-L-gulonate 2-dehydrogenase